MGRQLCADARTDGARHVRPELLQARGRRAAVSEVSQRVLAWSILVVAAAVFGVYTWPALPFMLIIGGGILAVLWAICFLVISYDK